MMRAMQPGDEAPDFELLDQDDEPVRLSSLRGQTRCPLLLPARQIRPAARPRRAASVTAAPSTTPPVPWCWACRPTAPPSCSKFADKYGLDFTLLSDEDHAVAETYGTWVEKSMYGKKYMGVQRATFVIDPDGRIAHVLPKVSPKTHDDEVLKALAATHRQA